MQLEELGQNVNFRVDIHKICHNPNKNYNYNRKLKTAEILNKIKPSNLNTNLKGVDKKKPSHLIFCFAHISASKHRSFKILVPNPHNIPLIFINTL